MSDARQTGDSTVVWAALERFLDGREPSRSVDFAGFCRAHPELEPRLRADARLQARVRSAFELAADESPGAASPPHAMLERLRRRGPANSRFKLLGEVARGGMGAILRVWDDDLQRVMAMKIVLGGGDAATGDTPAVDARTLGRFLDEAQITGQLDHPGIVPVHELGVGPDGRAYFTMRLVKGSDLRRVFERARSGEEGWTTTRALGVLLKVCEAMSYAHSKGVIHRDLKPANVMVGGFGEVYVMDWGLARVSGRGDARDLRVRTERTATPDAAREPGGSGADSPLLTMDGDVIGTPSYMPPEQALGRLELVGPWSDVYAVGAMLYQLLAGEMPYVRSGEQVSQRAILERVREGPPAALEDVAPESPSELAAICDKAMQRDPVARYRDMAALAEDLRAFLEGRVVRVYETGAWAEARKWMRRNTWLAAAIGAATLFLIAGAAGTSIYAVRAGTHASTAKSNADRAQELARIASARNAAIWALQEVTRFEELDRAAVLAGARSEHYSADNWLARARQLVDGQAEDPALGRVRRPGQEDHRRLLAEIRGAGDDAPDNERDWWIEQLTTLDARLSALRSRLERAELSVHSAEARQRWSEALAAIAASPHYAGLQLVPQLDLVPIGPDPVTGLWSFAHLPSRRRDGRPDSGALLSGDELAFVLVPALADLGRDELARLAKQLDNLQADLFLLIMERPEGLDVAQWEIRLEQARSSAESAWRQLRLGYPFLELGELEVQSDDEVRNALRELPQFDWLDDPVPDWAVPLFVARRTLTVEDWNAFIPAGTRSYFGAGSEPISHAVPEELGRCIESCAVAVRLPTDDELVYLLTGGLGRPPPSMPWDLENRLARTEARVRDGSTGPFSIKGIEGDVSLLCRRAEKFQSLSVERAEVRFSAVDVEPDAMRPARVLVVRDVTP